MCAGIAAWVWHAVFASGRLVMRVTFVEAIKHLLVPHTLAHSLANSTAISPASRMSLTASTVTKWATVAVMSAACISL